MFISDLLKRQPSIEDRLPPLRYHVSDHCVSYGNDRLLLTLALAGTPFETLDDTLIENYFGGLNAFFASMGKEKGSRLGIWTHLCRRKVKTQFNYQFRSAFMRDFAKKYLVRFDEGDYYENRFYISLVLKYNDIDDGIQELEELGVFVEKSLRRYDVEMLGMVERNGILFSDIYKFLGYLANGFEEDIPVTATPLAEVLGNSHLHFGVDVLELRGNHPDQTKYATLYDLKGFPDKTKSGLFDCILKLPFEFTLTQTFFYASQSEAGKLIDEQINQLTSVDDQAEHQIEEIKQAKGYISSGELVFGDYHAALVVFGGLTKDAMYGEKALKKAIDNGETARATFLGEAGAGFVKAALSAPVTYFGQIPGATKSRPRPMPKSSRQIAAAFAMHTYSSGKASGNPVGDGSAVAPLQTISKGLYNFNFHYSRQDEDSIGEKIAGHTLLLGATGTGKTVLQSTLLGFMERFDTKLFAIDKDYGMQIFIEAQGGTYFSLRAGEWTGLNPFQLPDTPKNREYLNDLLKECGKNTDGSVTADEEKQIKIAVDTNYSLPFENRRFSRVLETIPRTGEKNELAARLEKWTVAGNGRYAWALDNPTNSFDITSYQKIGFDVTDFLKKGYEPTGPVLSYLFHLKSLMQQSGGLMVTVVEEFWLPAQYEITSNKILDILKTGRKLDEFIVLVSQSPEDAIMSDIFPAVVQQTPTKVLLPNPAAKWEGYKAINLTRKEFDKLVALSEDSRTFLVKQGNQSVFATLDLHGFNDELAVISGSLDNVAVLNRITAEVGHDPDVWLPIYQQQRHGKSKPRAETN